MSHDMVSVRASDLIRVVVYLYDEVKILDRIIALPEKERAADHVYNSVQRLVKAAFPGRRLVRQEHK